MPFFHVYPVRFVLIDTLIALTLDACFRILREPEARMKRPFCAKVPILGITENSIVLAFLSFFWLRPSLFSRTVSNLIPVAFSP